MSDHGHDAEFPTIWFIVDANYKRIGETIQFTKELAEVDVANRYRGQGYSVVDSGKRKPPAKCCNKCGDKPCE